MRHIPNLICLFRIALVWPIATALEAREYLIALALFMLAGLSDGIDGYLAKRYDWTSDLGRFLDPLADKLLLVTVFVEAAWLGLAPWWLTAAVVSRDVFIGVGAFLFHLWVGPLRGRPTLSSKLNTLFQLLFPVAMLANAALSFPSREVLDVLAVLVFVTTVVSGLNYLAIFTRRAWAEPARSSY